MYIGTYVDMSIVCGTHNHVYYSYIHNAHAQTNRHTYTHTHTNKQTQACSTTGVCGKSLYKVYIDTCTYTVQENHYLQWG